MSLPRYAARTDSNQKEIVDALRKIGCQVEVIGKPVDLLVSLRGYNFLIECKLRGSKNRRDQQAQRDWVRAWNDTGQCRVVTSAEEAIQLVTAAYGS